MIKEAERARPPGARVPKSRAARGPRPGPWPAACGPRAEGRVGSGPRQSPVASSCSLVSPSGEPRGPCFTWCSHVMGSCLTHTTFSPIKYEIFKNTESRKSAQWGPVCPSPRCRNEHRSTPALLRDPLPVEHPGHHSLFLFSFETASILRRASNKPQLRKNSEISNVSVAPTNTNYSDH